MKILMVSSETVPYAKSGGLVKDCGGSGYTGFADAKADARPQG